MLFAHDRELFFVSKNARSLHLACPARFVKLYAQRASCTSPAVIAITVEFSLLAPPEKKKEGSCGNCVKGPLGGPFPPPPPKKKVRREEAA